MMLVLRAIDTEVSIVRRNMSARRNVFLALIYQRDAGHLIRSHIEAGAQTFAIQNATASHAIKRMCPRFDVKAVRETSLI